MVHTPQHTAAHCNTPQHTTTHCNTLQHTATYRNTLQHTATHCNILQHTATHSNTQQHTATHCNTLQHTATHCNIPVSSINASRNTHTWISRGTLTSHGADVAVCCSVLQCVAVCCGVMLCVAVCCSEHIGPHSHESCCTCMSRDSLVAYACGVSHINRFASAANCR